MWGSWVGRDESDPQTGRQLRSPDTPSFVSRPTASKEQRTGGGGTYRDENKTSELVTLKSQSFSLCCHNEDRVEVNFYWTVSLRIFEVSSFMTGCWQVQKWDIQTRSKFVFLFCFTTLFWLPSHTPKLTVYQYTLTLTSSKKLTCTISEPGRLW